MAKLKRIVHSEDACTMIFDGDIRCPEPTAGIIKFPGGHVEVSRTSDGTYWAHIAVNHPSNTVASRIDYDFDAQVSKNIIDVPEANHIQHLALRIRRDKAT